MIDGITVTLYERVNIGSDAFGAPVYEEHPVDVAHVLVTPVTAEDIVTDKQLYGKHTEYELCLPKDDTHNWEDCRVDFFGKSWRVFGPVREWISEQVPLRWNKKIKVERYE